ncbi:MAG TPA: acyltransferase [Thermoleophilaceae bacterium]|nr:acyltransferase [Thermoleophilaceae bacterium]
MTSIVGQSRPVGTEAPANLATPSFPLLHSARGVAALGVFAAHALLILASTGLTPKALLDRLELPLEIFLLLSGFLLYRPFVQARLSGSVPPATAPYAIRRLLRIVPQYWLVLPVAALALGLDYVFAPKGLITYFGFLQIYDSSNIQRGIGPAWSLCVELSFYALLPIWAWLLRRLGSLGGASFLASELLPLGGLAVGAIVWKAYFFASAPKVPGLGLATSTAQLYMLPAFLDVFAAGMALAVLSVVVAEAGRESKLLGLIDRQPWLPVLVGVCLFWVAAIGGGTYSPRGTVAYIAYKELTLAAAVALLLPAVFGDTKRGWSRRALGNRALTSFATVSYGFFLWHLPVMLYLQNAGWLHSPGRMAWLFASFAISLLLSIVSYYAVGRPAIRLGARVPRDGLRGHRRRRRDAYPLTR